MSFLESFLSIVVNLITVLSFQSPIPLWLALLIVLCILGAFHKDMEVKRKYGSLLGLFEQAKIHTINYMLAMDYLTTKDKQNPKNNDLYLATADFSFTIDDTHARDSLAHVQYCHTFHFATEPLGKFRRTKPTIDFLILHAYGEFKDVWCKYNQEEVLLKKTAVPEIAEKIPVNRKLTRCTNDGRPWGNNPPSGVLDFGYTVEGEHYMKNEIEAFVICPQNYAKKIRDGASFRVKYTSGNSCASSVELHKHSRSNGKFEMRKDNEATTRWDDTKHEHICKLANVDMDCVYFLLIKYDVNNQPSL